MIVAKATPREVIILKVRPVIRVIAAIATASVVALAAPASAQTYGGLAFSFRTGGYPGAFANYMRRLSVGDPNSSSGVIGNMNVPSTSSGTTMTVIDRSSHSTGSRDSDCCAGRSPARGLSTAKTIELPNDLSSHCFQAG